MIRPSTTMAIHALLPKKYLIISSLVRPGMKERPRVESASFSGRWSRRRIFSGAEEADMAKPIQQKPADRTNAQRVSLRRGRLLSMERCETNLLDNLLTGGADREREERG